MTELIMQGDTPILRPSEFKQLLSGAEHSSSRASNTNGLFLKVALFTGMRYEELVKFQKNPRWFNGESIHIPSHAQGKSSVKARMINGKMRKERKQPDRWVRLTPRARELIPFFLSSRKLPTRTGWNENLKRWAELGGLDGSKMSAKVTRKTYESWIIFYYLRTEPNITILAAKSQGHDRMTQFEYYLNIPFNQSDREAMKEYVEGWSPA
jgi:integrase